MEDLEPKTDQQDQQNHDDLNQAKDENTSKLNKISFPKRKYAIIHGYNGHQFCGNQKYFFII
jgi:hypothetical protein